MFKHLQKLLLFLALCVPWAMQAQVSLPYSTGFEDSDDSSWTFVNDATNAWVIGSATHNSGSSALYVSNDNGTSNAYGTSATQFSYAYLAFEVTDAGQFAVSFDWKANGEGNYDYLRAWIAPATVTLSAGTDPEGGTSAYSYRESTPAGWIDLGGKMNLQSGWQNVLATPNLSAGTYCLVLMWANDGSGGSQPPAAVDNVTIMELSCPGPAGISITDLTSHEATIYWTYGGSESQWVVLLGDSVVSNNWTDTSYTFTDLADQTNYTVRVKSVCGAGDTSLAATINFTTPCDVQELPYTINFDSITNSTSSATGAQVPCWNFTMLNSSYSSSTYYPAVYYSASYANSGSYSLRLYGVAYTALPPMEAQIDSLQIRLSHYTTSTSYAMQIGALEDDGTFVPLVTITDPASTHVDHTFYLNEYNYSGTSHTLAFYNYYVNSTTGYSYHYIDDIVIDYLPTCAPVHNVQANATVGAAVISWQQGTVGEYTGAYVEYKVDTVDTWTSATTTTNSIVITGLDAGTSYEARVRAICDGDDSSSWEYISFTTGDFGCAVVDPNSSFADTIINGTTTNSYIPSYSTYNYSLTQQIFTANEIGHGGEISKVYFMPSAYTVPRVLEIWMGHVDQNTSTSFLNPSDLTMVYNSVTTLSLTAGQWNEFQLSTPFNYNGSDNLLIYVRDMTGSWSSGNTWYGETGTSGVSRYIYQDGTPYTVGTTTGGTTASFRSNIILAGSGCLEAATCAAPAASVDNFDTNSVTISWAPGATETTWEVWYRMGNNGAYSVADNNVTNMEYTFTNLQPGTEYNFKIVNICDQDTFASATLSCFTDCAPVDVIVDDFESYATGATAELNPCWVKGQYGTSTQYPYVTTSGSKCLYFYGYNYNNGSTRYYDWIVLSEMRDSLNTYEMEFDMKKYSTSANYPTTIMVGAMTDPHNISTFDTLAMFTANTYDMWESFNYSFEDYHGEGQYICLMAPSLTMTGQTYVYNYVYLDNLYVGRRSSCTKPTRFHARDITANSATLTWDSLEVYNTISVLYNTVNDITSATQVTTSDASVDINGLTANTTYYCWLTAYCSEDSSRTVTCSFTTTEACNPVVNLTVTEATMNMASITWQSDEITPATSYTFEWKEADSTTWNTVTTNNTYYQLTNLNQGTTYNVRVIATCDNDVANAATVSFTTTIPGTIGNNEGSYYIPTYPYYEYSISEQMWTANELAEYGDTIHGIYFNALSDIAGREMQMWIIDTTLADLSTSNYIPSTAMTLVLDSTINIVTGWNYFPFDEPYVRDLNKNLVLLTYDHTGSYLDFDGFVASTSAVNSLYSYQDDTPYSTTDLSSLNAEGVRAQMLLEATMTQPTCMAPHPVVSDVTDNSISLVWIAGLNETSWSVEYRVLGDTSWTVATASTTNTSITVNGLNPSTTYVFRIGALCTDNTMYAAVRGTTACGSFSAPYIEDFNIYSSNEYDFDPCWYKGNMVNTNMPYIVNITGQGPCMLMPQGSYVIFPQVGSDISTLRVRLQYVVADASIFSLVGVCSHPEDILSMTVIDTLWASEAGVPEWNTITLDSYSGSEGYVAIYSCYNQTYYDNIHIELIPQCGTVDSITANNVTTTSAEIEWQAATNAGSYLIEYGPLGSTNYNTVIANGNTHTLTNLIHSTTYDVNIYTICPTLSDTSIAANFKFQTECDTVSLPYFEDFEHCNAPALTMTGILPNCWNFMFTAGNTSYAGATYAPQLYSGTSYAHSGQYSLRTYGQSIITLPEMPVDVSQLQLSMHDYYSSTGYYAVVVGVCDSNWGNFEQSFVGVDTLYLNTTHVDFTTYRLASYTGNGRFIAFKNIYQNSTSYYSYNYIDDISIDYLPSCLPVVDLHSNGNTSSSISIDWTDLSTNNTNTNWIVSYSTTPLNDPMTGTVAEVTSHPYNVTGLTAGTNYYFYVRNVCTAGDSSIWTSMGPVTPGTWLMRANVTDTLYMCGGAIYDEGGPNGNYFTASQDSYIILRPDAPSNLVSITGSSYTEGSYDYIRIYDGEGTTGTELWNDDGTSALQNFGPLTSTTGPLTIYFHCDGSVYYSGFEINVSCISQSCMVLGLGLDTNVAESSSALALAWDNIGALSYQIAYGTPGFDVDTANIIETTDTHYTITGLSALVNYEVYVRGICSNADTGTWVHKVFQTAMCDNVVISQNFVDSIAGTTSTYSPLGTSFYKYSYNQIIIDSADLAEVAGDISAFAFQPATTSQGNYYTHITVFMANIPDSLNVASSFIHPAEVGGFDTVINDRNMCYTTTDWQLHGFDQPFTWDGHSNILISIQRNHGSYSSGASFNAHSQTAGKARYIYQDSGPYDPSSVSGGTAATAVGDIRLFSCGVACTKPSALPATDITYQSATLNWNSNATDFEVAVKASTDAVWPAEVAVNGATSYAVTGLMPETQYQFRVRAICDAAEGLISDWVEGTFTTAELPCFDPENLVATGTGYTTATLVWDADESQNQWSVKVWNNNFNQEYTATGAATYTVTGLAANTTYNAAVKSLCGNGIVESGYSDTIQFTTNVCGRVTGVTTSGVTAHSVVVSWNDSGVSKYKLEYGDRNFSEGNGTTVIVDNATSYTITGLDEDHNYSVFVKAVCEEGVEGDWSEQADFSTPEGEGINEVSAANQLSIYPNPANDVTTIAVSGVNGEVSITIVDMNGRVVASDSMSCEGDCTKSVEVSGLAQGAYFVRVNGENLSIVRKLIVK